MAWSFTVCLLAWVFHDSELCASSLAQDFSSFSFFLQVHAWRFFLWALVSSSLPGCFLQLPCWSFFPLRTISVGFFTWCSSVMHWNWCCHFVLSRAAVELAFKWLLSSWKHSMALGHHCTWESILLVQNVWSSFTSFTHWTPAEATLPFHTTISSLEVYWHCLDNCMWKQPWHVAVAAATAAAWVCLVICMQSSWMWM